jgi:hypothetical protein
LTYLERKKSYGPDKLCWEEAEEKTRLRQYVSLLWRGDMITIKLLRINITKMSIWPKFVWQKSCVSHGNDRKNKLKSFILFLFWKRSLFCFRTKTHNSIANY